jgi:hypothetical protein
MGQRTSRNVHTGVQVAELEGHSSRSAVYLVHKGLNRKGLDHIGINLEGLGHAPRGGGQDESAGVTCYEMGCYHTRSVNVL